MGPGKDSGSHRGITDPPVFEPDQDLLVWRKRVASWVDLISVAAEKGTDKLYKTVFATLARQLYDRGLRQAQKSIVDEAQERGDIDYKQDNQVKAVQEIVDLIAIDPPIAVVTRLIDSFNKVVNCRKRNSEDLNRFVSRFRGLAAEHQMRAGATSSSQVGEVLAITLLNNAELSPSTLTQAKLQLIALAESRQKDEKETPFSLSIENAVSVLSTMEALVDLCGPEGEFAFNDDDSREVVAQKLNDARQEVRQVVRSLIPARAQISKQKSSRENPSIMQCITTTGPRCTLRLDDAVSVLRSLAQTNTIVERDSGITKTQMQQAVTKEVRSLFSSIPGSSSGNQKGQPKKSNSGQTRNSNSGREGNGSSSKKRKTELSDAITPFSTLSELCGARCRDCGCPDHTRGDRECKQPSYATRRIREAKASRPDENSGDDGQGDGRHTGFFRPGSKIPNGNGA